MNIEKAYDYVNWDFLMVVMTKMRCDERRIRCISMTSFSTFINGTLCCFFQTLLDRCCLCNNKEETIDHLLMYYSKAYMLWQLIFSLWMFFFDR